MAKEKVVTPKGEVVMVLTGKDAFDAMIRMMVECAEGGNKGAAERLAELKDEVHRELPDAVERVGCSGHKDGTAGVL